MGGAEWTKSFYTSDPVGKIGEFIRNGVDEVLADIALDFYRFSSLRMLTVIYPLDA